MLVRLRFPHKVANALFVSARQGILTPLAAYTTTVDLFYKKTALPIDLEARTALWIN